jgi:hypothetical protein
MISALMVDGDEDWTVESRTCAYVNQQSKAATSVIHKNPSSVLAQMLLGTSYFLLRRNASHHVWLHSS